MPSRSFWIAAALFLGFVALVVWPGRAQQTATKPDDKSVDARLAHIEKQLAEIQEQLKKLEPPKVGWQKIKDGTNVVVYMDSTSGKVKYIYIDGTERVTEK